MENKVENAENSPQIIKELM